MCNRIKNEIRNKKTNKSNLSRGIVAKYHVSTPPHPQSSKFNVIFFPYVFDFDASTRLYTIELFPCI